MPAESETANQKISEDGLLAGEVYGELSPETVAILQKEQIKKLMTVQSKTIPIFMEKKDMMVFAGTGTGKTLSYIIPLMEILDKDFKHPQGLILLPTHGLARQVFQVAKKFLEPKGIDSLLLLGGVQIKNQIDALKNRPKLIIGTPGRILDLIDRRKLRMHDIKTIVLDEGDFLIDGFYEDIRKIIMTTLKERQIVLYAATEKKDTIQKMETLMKTPEILKIDTMFPKQIKHFYILDSLREHFSLLKKILPEAKKAMIFLKSDFEAKALKERLDFHGFLCSALYGGQENVQKSEAIDSFRNDPKHILVATDMACRGLDIPDIDTVIHLQVPDRDTYIHRSGRTGRMGKMGKVIVIGEEKDRRSLQKIESDLSIVFDLWVEKEKRFNKTDNALKKPRKLKKKKKRQS